MSLLHIKLGHITTAKQRKRYRNRKASREGETRGRGQRQLKINKTKREKAVNLCLISSLQPVQLEWLYQEHASSSRLSL